MIRLTFLTSIILILSGVGFYVGVMATQGDPHITTLIPAFLGVILFILGLIATRGRLAHIIAMHLAVVLALLGIIGSASGVPKLYTLITTGESARGVAPVLQSIMVVVLLIYLALGVRSFVVARRRATN